MRHALGVDDALALAKLLQGPLGFFELLAQTGQPFGQPGTGLLGHRQAGIHVRLDEAVGHPVGGIRGEFLVMAFVADPDQLAVAHQLDGQLFLETPDDGSLQFSRGKFVALVFADPGGRQQLLPGQTTVLLLTRIHGRMINEVHLGHDAARQFFRF